MLKWTVLLVFLWYVSYLSALDSVGILYSQQNSTLPESELDALEAIYNATNGEHWVWTGVPWNFSQPDPNPCIEQWQGIQCIESCNASSCIQQIWTIYLSNNSMSGTLPNQIGDFPALVNLSIIENNFIFDTIPYSIGNLTALEALVIRHSSIDGPLPESIGNLVNLRYLELTNTSLTGSLPPSL